MKSIGVIEDQEFLSRMYEMAGSLNDRSILLMSGSIAMLIGGEFKQPNSRKYKWPYLVFLIPAWTLFSFSFYLGDKVTKGWVNGALVEEEKNMEEFVEYMFISYEMQRLYFLSACFCLALWLVYYLVWWVFVRNVD